MAARADIIISDLYKTYINNPVHLPSKTMDHVQTRGLERTVCDYIAGMTDRFALEEHNKLQDKGLSIQEAIGDI